MTRPTRQ